MSKLIMGFCTWILLIVTLWNICSARVYQEHEQDELRLRPFSSGSEVRQKRQAIRIPNSVYKIWTNATVYYYFDKTLSEVNKRSFQIAAKFWEANTCLVFKNSAVAKNRIRVWSGEGCLSYIGMTGGEQEMSLDDTCKTASRHEIGHAIGLHHTQQRHDRDHFVIVRDSNIEEEYKFAYEKESTANNNNYGIGFDYGSLMLYKANDAMLVESGPLSMISKDPVFLYTMGNDQGSFNDILMVNRLYGCDAICATKPNKAICNNGGIPNPKNCAQCLCPHGYAGDKCLLPQRDSCGAVIKATAKVNTMEKSIRIDQSGVQYVNRECTVHIKAPIGRKVEVQIKRLDGHCSYGCEQEGIEIKARKDPRFRGILYCCQKDAGKKIVSESNVLPVIFYSQYTGELQFAITYRWVPATTPSTTTYKVY